jgi:site-specific DNA-methyltransferase (adenine-specific)
MGRVTDILLKSVKLGDNVIITPQKITEKMIERMPQSAWNPYTKFLDITGKTGEFAIEIVNKLMSELDDIFPDKEIRRRHILNNQIFHIALGEYAQAIIQARCYGELGHKNVILMPEAQLKKKNNAKSFLIHNTKEVIEENWGKDMQFDVIIGNPPYQETIDGSDDRESSTGMYQNFIKEALDMGPKYMSFIVPSKWMVNARDEATRNKLIENDKYKMISMDDYVRSQDVFPEATIRGNGVCHFLIRRQTWNTPCKWISHINGEEYSEDITPIIENDMVIRYKHARNIIRRMHVTKSMQDLVSSMNPFGLNSTIKGEDSPIHDDSIKILVSGNDSEFKGGVYRYISKSVVARGAEYINSHKVYIPQAGDNTLAVPAPVINKAIYGPPGSVCNMSYLLVGGFNSEAEALNVASYLETKFVRFLIQVARGAMSLKPYMFKCVPIENFSRSWTDQDLYIKYGITAEEQEFIELIIKDLHN